MSRNNLSLAQQHLWNWYYIDLRWIKHTEEVDKESFT